RPRQALNALQLKRLQLAGVEWVQTKTPWARNDTSVQLDSPLAGDTRVTYDGLGNPSSWAHVPKPMPRVRLVTKSRVSVAPAQDIKPINTPSSPLLPTAFSREEGPAGTASIEFDKPGHIRVSATAPSRQLLLLTESWHEGWQVSVDGVAR